MAKFERSQSPIRWLVLFLACVGLFGSYYVYDNPGAMLHEIENYLNIDNTQYNLLYSVYSFPNTVLPFFGGFLVDRMGTNISMFVFLSLICAGQAIFWLGATVKNFTLCIIGRMVFGFGGESLSVATSALLATWFKNKEMAFAMGLNLSVARLGSVINDQVSPAMHSVPLALLVGFFICCVSLASVVVLSLVDKMAERKAREQDAQHLLENPATAETAAPAEPPVSLADVREFSYTFWLLCISCVIVYGAVLPFNNISGGLFSDKWNLDTAVANRYLLIPFLISACLSPFMGGVVDVFGKRAHLLTLSALSLCLGHGLLGFVEAGRAGFIAQGVAMWPAISVMIIGFSYCIYAAAIWPSIALVVPERTVGTAYGVVTAVQNLGLAVFPLMVGAIQDSTCDLFYTSTECTPTDGNPSDYSPPCCRCFSNCSRSTELFFCGIAVVGACVGVMLLREDKRMGGVLTNPRYREQKAEAEAAAAININDPSSSSDR